MNASQMLNKMCHEVLSNADIKAICKSRGFSAKEAASRALFENFFLCDIGMESAIASLTKEETVCLRLLQFMGEEVDVSFFARIYTDEKIQSRYYYPTFTQRYKDVFKRVKTSLVRKGILLIAEANAWQGDTKMERWRFRFPREFERFLPPLIKSTRTFEDSGDIQSSVLRQKLAEIVGAKQLSPAKSDEQYRLKIVKGNLQIGSDAFYAERLSEWQQACWEASAPPPEKKQRTRTSGPEKSLSLTKATIYVFSQLEDNEWIRPDQLNMPLQIFCNIHWSGDVICKYGWQWGILAKQEADGNTYYRLPEEIQADTSPEHYLHTAPDHPIVLNLETVPYDSLELLAQISNVQAADSGQPHLVISPDLIKIGNVQESIRHHPLTQWLYENAPDFRQALETVEQRWGKQIVHENLLIAHVDDLVLKVQLEKAFPNPTDVVFLPNDYIAFPNHLLTAVEKVITKSGHVIRTVMQND
ncbi:MAG: hypothetical protein GY832_45240 [Chloroflexi bacterium]|nr:hypothetical protein [Chloroflexota bacterium]